MDKCYVINIIAFYYIKQVDSVVDKSVVFVSDLYIIVRRFG